MLGIDYSGQKFSLSSDPKNAVAVFSPAVLFMDGREMRLDLVWTDGYTIVSQKNDFHVTDVFKDNGDGLFSVRRSIKNVGNVTHEIKSIFEAKILFTAEKFLIPCVSYNKNSRGSNGAPAGFEYMGENWVFAYDRSGIPSCTLSENQAVAFALFASDRDADSLRSSCSFLAEAGETVHRLIHPVTEAPYTYSGKAKLTERYDEFITLAPGATFDCEMFMYACRPRRQNYAFAELADRILEEKKDQISMVLPPETVWQLGIEFAKALLYDYKGYRLTITHFAPRLYRVQHDVGMTTPKMAEMMKDPYYTELGRFDERFEIGWADQGLLNARMMAVHAHKTQDSELFDTAVGIFDAWTEKQGENGLLYTQFQLYYEDEAYDFALPDVCNLGWAMAEMVRMYRFLQSIGIEKRAYLTFATRLCDFFCTHYSDEYGFGKSWTLDGECVDTTGSIGGFIIPGLLETYQVIKDSRYLDCALKAMDFYYKRDIDDFVCLAGALDCCCIDKETAYPFVVAANMLYEITGEACHLERAKQASYYFLSWMFFYNALYPDTSDFEQYGFKTMGGTACSVEHHGIDAWGAALVSELILIWKHTGDEKWKFYAAMLWSNAIMAITTDEKQEIHGQKRPLGAQNEAFAQCRWTKYRPTCEDRGSFNDCLAGWMGAYRMMTLDRILNECQEKDWSLLR